MKIGIVDYAAGNISSIAAALKANGADPVIVSSPKELQLCQKLILPGVGSFGPAMGRLWELDLVDSIRKNVDKGVPLLGICLGMQILFEKSEESPGTAGLSILRGTVERLPLYPNFVVPQIQWNKIVSQSTSSILGGDLVGGFYYFAHSYYVIPSENKIEIAKSIYGDLEFISAIQYENLWATQFHPEKSAGCGLNVIRSFINN
jgi:glutamine amidotransferase